ncbi:MAG: uridine-cytidine kinase [Mollicutes bacterium PWAP]|nr:uridine-cytidine kinase [Mollicutes bacterium PWAP]
MKKLILVAGGTASGKTTVAKELVESLGDSLLIRMDEFYLENKENIKNYNYDAPYAFDIDLIIKTLLKAKKGEKIYIPKYNYNTHSIIGHKTIDTSKYNTVIFEGILSLFFKELRELADLKIYVETPDDIRLARRIKRDVVERGRDINKIIWRWNNHVRPSQIKYINKFKYEADIIIPWLNLNKVSIKSVVSSIRYSDD